MSWRKIGCVFELCGDFGGRSLDKTAFYTFLDRLEPVHQPKRDERLGWPDSDSRNMNLFVVSKTTEESQNASID